MSGKVAFYDPEKREYVACGEIHEIPQSVETDKKEIGYRIGATTTTMSFKLESGWLDKLAKDIHRVELSNLAWGMYKRVHGYQIVYKSYKLKGKSTSEIIWEELF